MKRSASCFGAFLLDSHFETHLQNGSIFCICRRTFNLSADKDFGVALCMLVTSGDMVSVWNVEFSDELH